MESPFGWNFLHMQSTSLLSNQRQEKAYSPMCLPNKIANKLQITFENWYKKKLFELSIISKYQEVLYLRKQPSERQTNQ